MEHIRCVFVGDSKVGKTSILISYTTNAFPSEYIPSVFDNYTANVMIDGIALQFEVVDTTDTYRPDLRPLSYTNSDVVCICFAIHMPSSLRSVEEKWVSLKPKLNPLSTFPSPPRLLPIKSSIRRSGIISQIYQSY